VTGDAGFYDRALRRMDALAIALGAAAVVFFAVREGWRGALGCGVCAVASVYNLRRLKRIAEGVGGSDKGSNTGSALGLGLRYLILAGACFGIIRYFEVSLAAIFAGLFVSVAAVLLEMAYELVIIR
jgi:hypothetical protein